MPISVRRPQSGQMPNAGPVAETIQPSSESTTPTTLTPRPGDLSVKDDGPIVEGTFVTTMRLCSDCLIIRRIQYGKEFLPLTTKPTA